MASRGQEGKGPGLTCSGVPAAGVSSSLSDDASLLLPESSSGLPALAWGATSPAFRGGAGVTAFPGVPLAAAEEGLTWRTFVEAFTWEKRKGSLHSPF